MLVYSNLKSEFISDVLSNRIGEKILGSFRSRLGKSPSPSEIASWQNSLEKISLVINEPTIPGLRLSSTFLKQQKESISSSREKTNKKEEQQ